MSSIGAVPLAEAAVFTCGCAVLRSSWIDPKRAEIGLLLVSVVLAAAVLIAATPETIELDRSALDPATAWLALSGEID